MTNIETKEYLTIAAKFYGVNEDELHAELMLWLIRLSGGVQRCYVGNEYRTEAGLRSAQVIGLACMTWEALNPGKSPTA